MVFRWSLRWQCRTDYVRYSNINVVDIYPMLMNFCEHIGSLGSSDWEFFFLWYETDRKTKKNSNPNPNSNAEKSLVYACSSWSRGFLFYWWTSLDCIVLLHFFILLWQPGSGPVPLEVYPQMGLLRALEPGPINHMQSTWGTGGEAGLKSPASPHVQGSPSHGHCVRRDRSSPGDGDSSQVLGFPPRLCLIIV